MRINPRFDRAMADAIDELVERKLKEDSASSESMMASYLQGTPPKPSLRKPVPPSEAHIFRMTSNWLEILQSVETLETITKYMRRESTRPRGVSHLQHLRLFFESYLNEFYILQNRLDKFLTVVERAYRKNLSQQQTAVIAELKTQLATLLKGGVDARGAHVHAERYDDHDLQRVFVLESISRHNDLFQPDLRRAIREVRAAKTATLRSNTKTLRSLAKLYFDVLTPILLDEKGKLRIPTRLMPSTQ
jgi:hypothetical protein